MLLSSDKLVIMKIVTCALVTIFIITRLSDDNITLSLRVTMNEFIITTSVNNEFIIITSVNNDFI